MTTCMCVRKSSLLRTFLRLFPAFLITFLLSCWLQHILISYGVERCAPKNIRVPTLQREMRARDLVLICVMTRQGYVNTRATAIHRTWAQNIPGKILYFVGISEKKVEADIPLVMLQVADDIYPPQRKAMLMLKYTYENYGHAYRWFIRADDDVYFNGRSLAAFLTTISSSEDLLLGHLGLGKGKEFGKLGLPSKSNFCIGGPGVIMTRSVLEKVYPHLEYCMKNFVTQHEDSEVGRCLRLFAGVQCPWGYEASEIFHQDYGNSSKAYHGNIDMLSLDTSVSFHPVKDSAYLVRFHHNFLSGELRRLLHRITILQKRLKTLHASNFVSVTKKSHCGMEQCDHHDDITEETTFKNGEKSPKPWAMFQNKVRYDVEQLTTPVNAQAWNIMIQKAKRWVKENEKSQLHHAISVGTYSVGYTRENPIHYNLYEVHFDISVRRDNRKTYRKQARVMLKNFYGPLSGKVLSSVDMKFIIHIVILCQDCFMRLEKYLENIHHNLAQENARLLLVSFQNDTHRQNIKKIYEKFLKKFDDMKLSWLETANRHLYGEGSMQSVLMKIPSNQLILITHVDAFINHDFLRRCRLNAESAATYFPIARLKNPSENLTKIVDWNHKNFSVLCVLSDELRSVMKRRENQPAASLVDRFLSRGEQHVFRAFDPDLQLFEKSRWPCVSENCSNVFQSSESLFDYMSKKGYIKTLL